MDSSNAHRYYPCWRHSGQTTSISSVLSWLSHHRVRSPDLTLLSCLANMYVQTDLALHFALLSRFNLLGNHQVQIFNTSTTLSYVLTSLSHPGRVL